MKLNKPLASMALIASLVSVSNVAQAALYDIGTVSSFPGFSFAVAANPPGPFIDAFSFNLATDSNLFATVLNLPILDISLFNNDGVQLQFTGSPIGEGQPAVYYNVLAGPYVAFVAGNSSGAIGGAYAVLMTAQPVPVPAAAWLLGSGLLGLVGVARRKEA